MKTLATKAMTETTVDPIKAALLIRVDHLTVIRKMIEDEFISPVMRHIRSPSSPRITDRIRKIVTACNREGLKTLGSSLPSPSDRLNYTTDPHDYPGYSRLINDVIILLNIHICACLSAAAKIED